MGMVYLYSVRQLVWLLKFMSSTYRVLTALYINNDTRTRQANQEKKIFYSFVLGTIIVLIEFIAYKSNKISTVSIYVSRIFSNVILDIYFYTKFNVCAWPKSSLVKFEIVQRLKNKWILFSIDCRDFQLRYKVTRLGEFYRYQ